MAEAITMILMQGNDIVSVLLHSYHRVIKEIEFVQQLAVIHKAVAHAIYTCAEWETLP